MVDSTVARDKLPMFSCYDVFSGELVQALLFDIASCANCQYSADRRKGLEGAQTRRRDVLQLSQKASDLIPLVNPDLPCIIKRKRRTNGQFVPISRKRRFALKPTPGFLISVGTFALWFQLSMNLSQTNMRALPALSPNSS